MSVSEVLLAAAELLEREGWRQGDWSTDGHGPFCAAAAIYRAPGDFPVGTRQRARERLRGKVGLVVAWNDADGRTAEEVIRTLQEVALGCSQEVLGLVG